MAKRTVKQWITVHGVHIPIYEGNNKKKSQKVVDEQITTEEQQKEEKPKEEPIKDEPKKEEPEKVDESEVDESRKDLPRQLDLDNIPAEEANKTTTILNLKTRKQYTFAPGTQIRRAYVFCGKGVKKPFEKAAKYAEKYPGHGTPEEWQHCAGWGLVTDGERVLRREIHWVQGNDGKMREAFIKWRGKKKS